MPLVLWYFCSDGEATNETIWGEMPGAYPSYKSTQQHSRYNLICVYYVDTGRTGERIDRWERKNGSKWMECETKFRSTGKHLFIVGKFIIFTLTVSSRRSETSLWREN